MNSASKRRNRAGQNVSIAKTQSNHPFGARPDTSAMSERICDWCGGVSATLLRVRGERVCVRCAAKQL